MCSPRCWRSAVSGPPRRGSRGPRPASSARRSRRRPIARSTSFRTSSFEHPLLLRRAAGIGPLLRRRAGRPHFFDRQPARCHGRVVSRPRQGIQDAQAAPGGEGNRSRLRAGLPSEVRREPLLLRLLHAARQEGREEPGRRHARVAVPRDAAPTRRGSSRRASRSSSPGCKAGTTAATCTSAPTASSTSPPATPPTRTRPTSSRPARTCGSLLSKSSASTWTTPTASKPYAVPKDNPFVDLKGARPEVWAFGFRNPWRMSFDRKTGQLWVGDVGWELWEMVHRVEKGGNYGWSIVEGRQPVNTDMPVGPTPIRAPVFELPHTMSASVTGGYVYRGKKFPELEGAYIFGDWETRRIWAARIDGDRLVSLTDLVEPTLRVVAFGEDEDGELYFVDYDAGTIHTLERNPPTAKPADFPRTLSATGLFASVKDHVPAEGVLPFSINAPQWADGATAERFVALPGDVEHHLASEATWRSPAACSPGGSCFRTTPFWPARSRWNWSAATRRAASGSKRNCCTTTASSGGPTRTPGTPPAPTPTWSPPTAGSRSFVVRDPDHARRQARDRLVVRRPGAVHGLPHAVGADDAGVQRRTIEPRRSVATTRTGRRAASARRQEQTAGAVDDRRSRQAADAVRPDRREPRPGPTCPLVPARQLRPLSPLRRRRVGRPGTARLRRRWTKTKAVDVPPHQGSFDLPDAKMIAAGIPDRSTLYYRMAKFGRGRMPRMGSDWPDEAGLALDPRLDCATGPAATAQWPCTLTAAEIDRRLADPVDRDRVGPTRRSQSAFGRHARGGAGPRREALARPGPRPVRGLLPDRGPGTQARLEPAARGDPGPERRRRAWPGRSSSPPA